MGTIKSVKKYRPSNVLLYSSAMECFESNYILEPNTGCWFWLPCINGLSTRKQNYGKFYYGKLRGSAHRISVELFHKIKLTPKDIVCHRCDTPYCVNPDHLFVGTQRDNIRDCFKKGRNKNQFSGKQKRTICIKCDHPVSSDGWMCASHKREYYKIKMREWRANGPSKSRSREDDESETSQSGKGDERI